MDRSLRPSRKRKLDRIRGAIHTLHDISTLETVDSRVVAFVADSLEEPVAWIEHFFAAATKAGEAGL